MEIEKLLYKKHQTKKKLLINRYQSRFLPGKANDKFCRYFFGFFKSFLEIL